MVKSEKQELCDLCGTRGAFYAKGKGCEILRCERCFLHWTNPMVYYVATDRPEPRYWAEDIYLAHEKSQKARFRRQLDTFLREARVHDPRTLRVLEVGCGLGFFMDVCEERGIAAQGCDISSIAVAHANRERQRARRGGIEGACEAESFDAIFAFNLIEHLPRPREFIVHCCQALAPGGILALETPIQESLLHRAARLGYVVSRGRLGFLGLAPGGHLYKFSRRTFQLICGEFGLMPVYATNISSPFAEISSKSSMFSPTHGLVFRIALPLLWSAARLTGQGNRLFILLRKPPTER